MPYKCLVWNCNSAGNMQNITYHSLGKHHYTPWLRAIGRSPNENLHPKNVVCSKHFSEEDFEFVKGKKVVKRGAVPKLNLPRNAILREIASTNLEPAAKKLRLDTCETQILKEIFDDGGIPGPSSALQPPVPIRTSSPQMSSNIGKDPKISSSDSAGLKGSPKRNRRLIKKVHTYAATPETIKEQLKMEKIKNKELRNKNRRVTRVNKRLRIRVNNLKVIVKRLENKKLLSKEACLVLEKTFSGIPLEIMKRILKNSTRGKISREKYNKTIRSFAMTLQFYSSKAYEYVRKTFSLALPSQNTIRSWYSNIVCDPGFSQPAFQSLKVKVKDNQDKGYSTLCSLMLDEMSIKKHIDYYKGRSWGYVDLGTNINEDDFLELATEVLVLMVVAVNGEWKLPIGYFFIHSLTGHEKANIVNEALIRLYDTGVIITSLTCDGPRVNFTMMSELGAKVNDINNIIPYFLHPKDKTKIFIIFDACHMIKILRNNWGILQKFIDPDGHMVDFKYILMLHQIQEEEGLRLGTKLKKAHLEWQKQKMKVNLAVQTLSESVASAIEFLMEDVKDPRFKEAAPTIRFIRLADKIFDLLNSRSPITVGTKMPIQVSNEEKWLSVFKDAIHYLKNCRTVNNVPLIDTLKQTPFKGFIITILSVIGIYDSYIKTQEPKLKYLLTYKFSQDHLELFFCSVRAKNGWNNNPSAWQFRNTYKRLLLHHDIQNMNGNCRVQDPTNILYVTETNKIDIPLEINDAYIARKYDLNFENNVVTDHDYMLPRNIPLTDISENVVAYVAGYAVKMSKKLLKCPTCINYLSDNRINEGQKELSLLRRKQWGKLIIPSKDVIAVCKKTEIALRRVFYITDQQVPKEKHFLTSLVHLVSHDVIVEGKLFKDLEDHNNEYFSLSSNHIFRIIKTLCLSYCKIRIYNLAKTQSYNILGDLMRKKLTKLILFKNQ